MAELLYRYHKKIVPSYFNSAINASREGQKEVNWIKCMTQSGTLEVNLILQC